MQNLIHQPIRPPRDMIEERVYSRHWQALMEDNRGRDRSPLEQILISYPEPIDQRAASIAASFICWLGTNVGCSFLRMGRRLSELPELCGQGYVAAWGVQNRRFHATNGGARAVEFLVRTEEEQRLNTCVAHSPCSADWRRSRLSAKRARQQAGPRHTVLSFHRPAA